MSIKYIRNYKLLQHKNLVFWAQNYNKVTKAQHKQYLQFRNRQPN